MTRRLTIEDKIGDWLTAFNAVREELTPRSMREAAYAWNQGAYPFVSSNDRTAALVAGMLVGAGGIRPIPTPEDV